MLTSQNTTSTMGEVAVVAMSEFESSYPTTEAQLEVWLSSTQSVEANCAYNEIATLQFRGPLDRQRLENAIENLVQRHAALRMTFSEDGQTTYVRKDNRFGFRWLETEATGSSSREEQHRRVIQEEAQKPFDLQQGPLFRVVGQSFSDSDHSVTITAHHAVLDGWSLALVCRDLGAFYDAAAGKVALPPAGSYQEYSKSMQEYFLSPEGQRDEAFWVERFSDQIPVLDLPIEHSRPSLRTYRAARHDHQLSIDLVDRLRRVGAKSGCSLFNTVLAAFQAFVGRISGNDDFCIGIPTAGQSAMNQHELVGHCVNTLPLRTQFDPSMTFREYLTRSARELLDAMDHQRYSFGQLLRKLAPPRDPSRPPMVSISFNLDPEINASELGFAGLDVRVQVEPRAFENFEWFVNGVIMEDKSVELQVQYNSDLFTAESIGYYMEGFAAFLNAVTVDPDQPVAKIHAMSVDQRRAQLVDWNQTSMPYPQGCTLHQEFSRQAAETPDRVAVEFGESVLTFKQIEERSNQVARYLQSQGVQCGDLVGICIERSERMLVYLMGILKSGAGYVPLDPAYPQDRLQYMCEHSKLKVIVTESTAMDVVKTLGKPSLDLDQSKDEVARQESSPVASDVGPANTCYVIYTSGSTGKPKGVVVPHDPVVNFLYSMKQTPGFGADDVVLAVTTLSFDIAVLELYLPLITGGKVVIADQLTAADGGQLVDKIQASGIYVVASDSGDLADVDSIRMGGTSES